MLVLGSHGHRWIEDFIYGETATSVRHGVKIPVLVVPTSSGNLERPQRNV